MNRPETLKQTLDSYLDASSIPMQFVIVDQTQDVDTRNNIQNIINDFSIQTEFEYIYQEMPSLTRARNAGYKKCKYSVIVISDDDVTVEDKTISNVFELMQNSAVSMIAGVDLNMSSNDSLLGYFFGKKSMKKRNLGYITPSVLGRFPAGGVHGTVDTEWAMGFFFVIRKELVDCWKLSWDENLISYAFSEDLDFSYSYYKISNKNNFRCIMSDKVAVYHRISKEWRITSYKSTVMYIINRAYLSYKHNMGFASHIAMRWTNFGVFLERLIKRDAPFDMVKAQWLCDINLHSVKSGILKPEWYE